MLHAPGLLMSWLTGRRAHILTISLSLPVLLRLRHLLAPLCRVSLVLDSVHGKQHLIFVPFCHTWFLALKLFSACNLLYLPLFCTSVSCPLFLFLSHPPPLPPLVFLHALFCVMPQGPPGPQGSPHPQPPPPNSMMGPHSQVTLHLSLSHSLFLFFSLFCYLYCHMGMLVLSPDASCFGIHHCASCCF